MNEFDALSIIIDTAIKHARHNQKLHGRRRGGAYVQTAMDFGESAAAGSASAASSASAAGGTSSAEYSSYSLDDTGYRPSQRAMDIVAKFAAMESKDDDRLRLLDRERQLGREVIAGGGFNSYDVTIQEKMKEMERLYNEYWGYDAVIRPEIMMNPGRDDAAQLVTKGHSSLAIAPNPYLRPNDLQQLQKHVDPDYQNDPEKWNRAVQTASKIITGMSPSSDPLNGIDLKIYPESKLGLSDYTHDSKIIRLGNPTTRTSVHEMTHAVEMNNPKIFAKALKYFEQRIAGEESRDIGEIYREYGQPIGNTGRRAYKDRFVHPYIGLDYRDMQYVDHPVFGWSQAPAGKRYGLELLSVGLDLIVSDPVNFAKRDPEHFAFVLDILQDPSNYERP